MPALPESEACAWPCVPAPAALDEAPPPAQTLVGGTPVLAPVLCRRRSRGDAGGRAARSRAAVPPPRWLARPLGAACPRTDGGPPAPPRERRPPTRRRSPGLPPRP